MNGIFTRLNIRAKLLGVIFPAVIISNLIILFTSFYTVCVQMRSTELNRSYEAVTDIREYFDEYMDEFVTTMDRCFYNSAVQDFLRGKSDYAEISTLFRERLSVYSPYVHTLYLTNFDEDYYYNRSVTSLAGQKYPELIQKLQKTLEERHGKTSFFQNRELSQHLLGGVFIYRGEFDRIDELAGAALYELDTRLFQNIFRQASEDAAYVLTDNNKNILYNKTELEDEKVRELLRYEGGKANGDRYFVKEQHTDFDNFVIYGMVNETKLLEKINDVFRIQLIIILLMNMVILRLVFSLAKHISKQIDSFICQLQDIARPGENKKITVESNDEFLKLADAYNAMYERISRLSDEIVKEKTAAISAQLEALQSQINPHFLYNTLDCINSLIDLGKSEKAKTAVMALAGIMRFSVRGCSCVTIREEKKFILDYLVIQKLRFQNQITFLVEIGDELNNYVIPRLCIQPLIENAILHGVSGVQDGIVYVFAEETEQDIEIGVRDNGCAMPDEVIAAVDAMKLSNLEKVDWPGQHIGLKNIQKRLLLLYGAGYGLNIRKGKSKGCIVSIRIPKQTHII